MIYFIGNAELTESTLYVLSTIQNCVDWLETLYEVNLDTETEGFFDHNNKIVMLQLNWEDITYIIDTRYVEIKVLKRLEQILVVGQNLKFDYKFLKFHGITLNKIYDTFVVECCITNGFENRELGLAALAKKYCNIILDKSVRNQFIGLQGQPFTEKQIVYGVGDVTCLTEIKTKQLEKANELDIFNWVCLENQACLAISDIEYNGFKLDTEAWLKLAKELESKIPLYETQLDLLVKQDKRLEKFVSKYVQGNLFGELDSEEFSPDRDVLIKWSSPVQIAKVLKAMKIDVKTTSEKDIAKYQDKEPLLKKFIDYKKDCKLATTYGKDFVKWVNKNTQRIHTEFWQILDTARVSSNNPNLQNLPAKNEYLNCFIAEKGWRIIGIDYAGQEARIAASGSKDELWLQTFREGKDLHSEVCKLMFGITDDLVRTKPEFLRGKSYRDAAKNLNFGVLFGMTEFKLSRDLNVSIDNAKELIKKYFEATKQLKSYLDFCKNYGLSKGYIRSFKPFSGIRFFGNWKKDLNSFTEDNKIIGEITRASYNTPIQFTGAVMTKLALVKIRDYIKDNNLGDKIKLIHVVHDATYCEVREEFAEEFSKIQSDLMIEAGKEFNLLLPMETDITIATCWQK